MISLLKSKRLQVFVRANSIVLLICAALSLPSLLHGQNGAGLPKFSPRFSETTDTIDMATLNVHLDIPLYKKQQRGGVTGLHLTYDSNIYPIFDNSTILAAPGWHLQNYLSGSGSLRFATTASECTNGYTGYSIAYVGFIFVDLNNTLHDMDVNFQTVDDRQCGGTMTSATGRTLDGVYSISVTGGELTSAFAPSGIKTVSSIVGYDVIDSNGNRLSLDSTFKDNTGAIFNSQRVTFPSAPAFASSETYKNFDSEGIERSVVVAYTLVDILAYNPSDFHGGTGGGYVFPIAGPWQTSVPTTITYPDNTYYQFTYEPTPNHPGYVTGRLASVRLPTGGTIQYSYFGGAGNYGYIDDAIDVETTAGLIRTTSDGATTYTRTAFHTLPAQTPSHVGATTLMQDPQGNETIVDSAFAYPQYVETRRRVHSGAAGGTPLLTTTRCYNGATGDCTTPAVSIPITSIDSQTSLNGGSSSRTVQSFNSNSLPTSLVEYDYGASVPTRQTTTNYASLGDILDRPSSVTVQDAYPNQWAKTSYEYDLYSLASTNPGLLGHQSVGVYRGNQTKMKRWVSSAVAEIETETHYDDAGQIVSTKDGRSNSTSFTYDYATDSCLNSTTLPTPSSGISQTFSQSCNANTNLVTSSTEPNGTVTAYGYDSMLRLTSITATRGSNIVAQSTMGFSGSTLPETITTTVKATPNPDQITTTTLDGYGRTSSTVNPNGATVLTTYDTLGRVQSVTNPYSTTPNGTTGYAYDALNRMTMECRPDNGSIVPCVAGSAYKQWTYSGSTVSERDEQAKTWTRTTNAFGQLTNVVEPGSRTTSYGYSPLGDLTSVTQSGASGDTARSARGFSYDGLSRLLTATNPESGTVCYGIWSGSSCMYGYDDNGNLLAKTDARGVVVSYVYDALNRVTSTTYSDGMRQNQYFSYDVAPSWMSDSQNVIGRLGNSNNAYGGGTTGLATAASYSYDAMGRIVRKWQQTPTVSPAGLFMYSEYDLAGNTKSVTYPDGRKVTQVRNSLGRPQSITFDSWNGTPVGYNYVSSANYNPNGSLQSFTYGNGVIEASGLNSRQQVSWITATGPSSAGSPSMISKQYCYVCNPSTTNNGNIGQISDLLNANRTQSFGYDNLNRIASFSTTGASQTYSIDSFGNLSQSGTAASVLTFDSANRITSGGFTYDASGNITTFNDGITSTTYAYDADGHVANVNGGTTAQYLYDEDGNRIRKIAWGDWTEYFYLNGTILAERHSDGSWSDYIYADGKRIARADSYDERIKLHGTRCSSCGSTTPLAAWYIPVPPGYVVKSGDKVSWRQFQGDNAIGGLSLNFTSGNTNWNYNTNDGQYMNYFSTRYTWSTRTASLDSYVGGTLTDVHFVVEAGTTPGDWDQYLGEIAIYSTDGTVTPLYNRSTALAMTYVGNAGMSNVSAIVERNISAGDAMQADNNTTYYLSDHLGTVSMEVAGRGWPMSSTVVYPFGRAIADSSQNKYKFTGKERDAESNLDYFDARYYASIVGRFMSPDSPAFARLSNPQAWNLYSYTYNNPLSFADPDGHDVQCTYDISQCVADANTATGANGRVIATTTVTHHSWLGGLIQFDRSVTKLGITGDEASFRKLGTNASHLLDLINDPRTVEVRYTAEETGAISYTPSQNRSSLSIVDPSGMGYRDTDAREQYPQVTPATTAEAFGHEVLGHIWGELIGGHPTNATVNGRLDYAPTTRANMRDAINAENAVRKLDPKHGQKQYNSHHHYPDAPSDGYKPPKKR